MEDREEKEMEKELYVAAVKGDVGFLHAGRRGNEYYLRKTSEKNNIIHIAIRYEQLKFIEVALDKFPTNYELVSEGNSIKNTPLHIAAEVGNFDIVKLLYEHLEKSLEGDNNNKLWIIPSLHQKKKKDKKPWREPNSKGNTPVHVAIIHDNVEIAKFLLNKDPYLARIVNYKSKEAPLHLAIKQHVNFSESESIMTKIRQPINEGGADLAIESSPQENMSSMIKFLIERESCVASWADANGMTPLHRAASLSIPYNLEITSLIITQWPQAAEVCDASGKSILHLLINKKIPSYQEGTNLLKHKVIFALRNHQDQQGNTPLHIAAKNKDTSMVRVLLESSSKRNINNSDGICAMAVIQQHNVFQMLRQRNMTKDESEAADRADIGYLKERLSNLLGIDFLHSKDSKGRNVLHKLMQIKNEIQVKHDEFVDFIKQILEIFPALVYQTDHMGNTPVHILVRNSNTNIYITDSQQINGNVDTNVVESSSLWYSGLLSELLDMCNKCIVKLQQEGNNTGAHKVPPWLMQNGDGNTPLHEAVLATNKTLALKLLDYDHKSAGVINKRNETPLHLLARSPAYMEPYDRADMDKIVKANIEAAHLPDDEGLTPILRAFKAGNLATATILCRVCPEAAKIVDTNGQIFWHLLIKQSSGGYFVYGLLQDKTLRDQLISTDKNGDTPLHLAITLNRFDIVQDFLDTWELERKQHTPESSSKPRCWWLLNLLRIPSKGRDSEPQDNRHHWLVKLLQKPNKAGKTPSDLIAESISLPPRIEESIKDRYELVGVRSVWRIPTTETKTYVNTMGVIAALLATITFTAAFAVPGGLFQDTGTPIMINKAAFQVFMISDLTAMCLSMIVLVLLLKIMATSDRRNSVVILDLCIALTLMSFCATLVTFMTGLFAAMFSVKPWIAIVTIALCSSITAFVLKFLFNKLLIPLKQTILYFSWMSGKKATQSFKRKEASNQVIVTRQRPLV